MAVGTPSIVLGGSVLFVLSMIGTLVWYAVGRQRKTGQSFVYTLFVAVIACPPGWCSACSFSRTCGAARCRS